VLLAVLAAGWAGRGWLPRASLGVAGVLAMLSLSNHYFDPAYARADSRGAAHLILQQEQPGDSIVVIYAFRPFRHYFADTAPGAARLLHVHKRYLATDAGFREHVADAARPGGRVWLVLSRWWDVAPEDRIRSYFDEALAEKQRWELDGVKVTLYQGRTT
jgi:hypothetical protein